MIKNQKLTELFHAEKKLKQLILKFVRCIDVAFKLFILLGMININLKFFYSLNFNLNENSLQFFKKTNLNYA